MPDQPILTEALKRQRAQLHEGEKVRHSVTIRMSPEDVFAFWRDFRNMPLFMKDISDVKILSESRSHWTVRLQHGPTLEWDSEIIAEHAGEMISWKSTPESVVQQAGSVWFLPAPNNQGTIVRMSLKYHVPGGKIMELATKLLGEDPDTLILINLRRLKAYLETGEVPTIEGQPSGRDEDARPAVTH